MFYLLNLWQFSPYSRLTKLLTMFFIFIILGGLLLTSIFGYGLFLVVKEFWEEEKRKQLMNDKRVEEERKKR